MSDPQRATRLLSVKDTLAILGIGRTQLYAHFNGGRLKAVKMGRRTLVSEAELARFVGELTAYRPIRNRTEGEL